MVHAPEVWLCPLTDDFVAMDPDDVDGIPFDSASGRCDAEELTRVSRFDVETSHNGVLPLDDVPLFQDLVRPRFFM